MPFKPSPRVQAFLSVYKLTASITAAAAAAKIHRSAHYRLMERSREYAEAFEMAHLEAGELLEREAWRRAKQGVKRMVLYHGKPVMVPRDPRKRVSKSNPKVPYFEVEYSDGLLTELLRAHLPEKYAQRVKKELSGPGGGPVESKLEVVLVKAELLGANEG